MSENGWQALKALVLLRRVYFPLLVEPLLAGCGLALEAPEVHQLDIGVF